MILRMSLGILLFLDIDMNKKIIKKNGICELLSPAGNYECLLSAIAAGCDAIYMAGKKFGARASADNFDDDELLRALDIAHLNNKKIYLTVNTLLKDDELSELCNYLRPYYEAGLDGVIVQDLGVIYVIRDNFPGLEIHGSTQMAITDTPGVLLAKSIGLNRIVLARELSLDEIKDIYNDTGIELECFIHGALCYSYSGKCLMSSFIGQRSGNRGRCAQPCRLEYNGEHLLSMKDLSTLEILDKLVDAGICSFKIEGRLKSPDYVYTVTSIYRKYLDMALSKNSSFSVDKKDLDILLSSYTRSGNCNGYYYKRNGHEMITRDFPGYNSDKKSQIPDAKSIEQSLKKEIELHAILQCDKPLEITVRYGEVSETVHSDVLIQRAQKRAMTEADIYKQIVKTGDTLFVVDNPVIEMEDDLFIPVSAINETRRMALTKLSAGLREKYILENRVYNEEITTEKSHAADDIVKSKPEINAEVCSVNNLEVILNSDIINGIILPITFNDVEKMASRVSESGKKVYLKMPYIIRHNSAFMNENKMYGLIDRISPEGVYISNLESLYILKSHGFDKKIIGDIHIYNMNRVSHDVLTNLGCNVTTVPVELNEKELLRRNIHNEDLIVYGKYPMMITAQCVRSTLAKRCEKEKKECDFTYIEDRYNNKVSVHNNCSNCTNVIYNTVPVSLHSKVDLIDRLSPSYLRFCFTDESSKETESILADFFDTGYEPVNKYTRGHLNRGVL